MLEFEKTYDDSVLTVALDGKLDTATTPELTAALEEDEEKAGKIIFDMAKLKYISSAGLRVLLSAQKTMNKQGSMVVKNVSEEIMEVFEVTGFSDILTIE